MQLTCYNCHKPFALGKDTIHAALDTIAEQKLSHYNAFCPHCRKANRVSAEALRRVAPDWHQRENPKEEPK